MVSNNLVDFEEVSSQVKNLFKNKKESGSFSGNIEFQSYFSSGKEFEDASDNNYGDVYGSFNTEIFGLPVGIEGFYTTQDRHREAKASFVRIHYDVEKAKSELINIISAYKDKMGQTIDKAKSIDQIYGSVPAFLEQQKNNLLSEYEKNYGIDGKLLEESQGDVNKMVAGLDLKAVDTSKLKKIGEDKVSSLEENKVKNIKRKLLEDKEKLQKEYQKIKVINDKIFQYKNLLDQYKRKVYLDSAINYKKIENLAAEKDLSYKELSKAASGLLPEGRVKKLATGLTSFDMGIINKYESDFTMAGQNLSGLSTGYDFGFLKTGISIGKTQYISRDGSVDQYTSYLGKFDFKPLKKQNFSLIYYGYTPSRKLFVQNDFFKKVDVALPTFRSPVHILSLNYEGSIAKFLSLKSEVASSYRNGDPSTIDMDKAAIKTSAQYDFPKLLFSLKAEWEHMGKNFQNATMPLTGSGTEKYSLEIAADLLRSFLSLRVQYFFLQQESFYSTSYNKKMGFDLKTHSKLYPTISFSYKPFATFRRYDDTFSIPQRPITGEVWTAKANYKRKVGRVTHNLIGIYNKNSSSQDTTSYHSNLMQVMYVYSGLLNTRTISLGWMETPSLGEDLSLRQKVCFLNLSNATRLTKQTEVNGGFETAVASFGIQRISLLLGTKYQFSKYPLALNLALRYTNFKASEEDNNKNLLAGQLGLGWRFKGNKKTTN